MMLWLYRVAQSGTRSASRNVTPRCAAAAVQRAWASRSRLPVGAFAGELARRAPRRSDACRGEPAAAAGSVQWRVRLGAARTEGHAKYCVDGAASKGYRQGETLLAWRISFSTGRAAKRSPQSQALALPSSQLGMCSSCAKHLKRSKTNSTCQRVRNHSSALAAGNDGIG